MAGLAIPLLLGLVLASGVALAALRLRLLTSDGAAAAVVIGTLTYGFGGWPKAALIVLFFVTSSLLTRVQAQRKSHPEHRRGRSGDQVLANGAVATLLAIWYGLSPSSAALSAFAGAIAASTADTWATEIGLLSPISPRLITTWKQVPPGSSGAVTPLGTIGGIVGAALIAFSASSWMGTSVVAVTAAGVIAMLLDSVLGATIEGRIRRIDNNAVNLVATGVGAVLGLVWA